MHFAALALAVLSLWDYPSRQPKHEQLRRQFVAAVNIGDAVMMEKSSRAGVELLPDDPTWRYNFACSLARFSGRESEALDVLEKAIDLGYRNDEAISADPDLVALHGRRRFDELLEYARQVKSRPILLGPMASVGAVGKFGEPVVLSEHNLGWNFDLGCFIANMKLSSVRSDGEVGELYVNRDRGHSVLDLSAFPGVTSVRLDKTGRERGMDINFPNMLFPYPVFGNCSRAFASGLYWRSLPRMLMTGEVRCLKQMARFYLSNQTWVFPAHEDIAPVGKFGDVFSSIVPYWIATEGSSYSDLPYLNAALSATRAFPSATRRELLCSGLLSPTVQTLIRKSLKGVAGEDDYLTPSAHPSAFPANGLDTSRLMAAARALAPTAIPPLSPIVVTMEPPQKPSQVPELTYAGSFAWALVLRADDERRVFFVKATGKDEYAFVQTHGAGVRVDIERIDANSAKIVIDRSGMSPTNRVDITVVGRKQGTGWGAPSYISFARMDPSAPYSDPMLTVPAKGRDR